MSIFATLRDRYGFTKTELSVIAVLGITYAGGAVLRWASGQPQAADVPPFDYTRIDSVFASRSLQKPATDSVKGTSYGHATAPVNINRAGVEELRKLPGIGQKLAERIVAYRNDHGFFRSVDELR